MKIDPDGTTEISNFSSLRASKRDWQDISTFDRTQSMNATFARCGLTTLVFQIATIAPAHDGPACGPSAPAKKDALDALEQKLLGSWKGPACGGDYTFNPDGTFE